MPLQIRRGTDAERIAMVQKLAEGELLWVTDAQQLYIGRKNPATQELIASSALSPVTGFTAESAQDAAALLFTTTPTHTGISFAYDDLANKITATVDLTNYGANINASITADDSSLLVDAGLGRIVGPVFSNVTGNLTGNVTGNLTGNVTGNLTGNVTGYHTGDVKGSIFADDSSPLVDAVSRIFYGTVDTGNTIIDSASLISAGAFDMGTAASPIELNLKLSNNLQIRQIADGVSALGYITTTISRGTQLSPTAVQINDDLGGLVIRGYTNTSTAALAGTISFFVDSTAVIAGGNFIKSKVAISASTDTGQNAADALVLDSAGIAASNAFSATKYFKLPTYANDAARTAAIPTPTTGMMVFMSTGTSPAVTNKVVVYDSTAWVALH